VRKVATLAGLLVILLFAPLAAAQVKVTDDLSLKMGGMLTAGYSASYGDQIPSSHGLNLGGSAEINGSYYDPNFLNFTVTPYYSQSRANSSYQSLTDSSGVDANANFFTGSRFPGYASYHYTRDSTGTFGLIGAPNFTTVGNSQGFGIGWSAIIPDWPTLSVGYSQGHGTGTLYGTSEESDSSTHNLNVRSAYRVAGWQLNAFYDHLNFESQFPSFLGGQTGKNSSNFSGNDFGANGSHAMPWNGTAALTFNHATYGGDTGSTFTQSAAFTDYTTNNETAVVTMHPVAKLSIFADQAYTNNLNGFFYQSLVSNGNGIALLPTNSHSNSSTVSGGANYSFSNHLFAQGQITYFNQAYFGQSYDGSYVSGTVGYGKRILNMFTLSATVIESSNKFADNSLGYMFNVNFFRRLGLWESSASFSYAQNVQTLLVTYTTSYYNYNANLHRRLGNGKQWTGAFSGSHSGFTDRPGTVNHSEGFSSSLALGRVAFNGNYMQSSGNSVLTSTGIQPIPPTPGLLPEGLIVYNGKSYGGGITLTPIPRLSVTGTYSHAVSDTLSNLISSRNRTEIYFTQFQYRLRKITVLGGFTKFSQGISAAGTPPGNDYSYFIGASRWLNFF
jgi:hypothetical protein